jgi:ABC-2 type transport system ATP-binding protein
MPAIVTRGLTKIYRVPLKEPGFRGALGHLVRPRYQEKIAVDGLDLVIEEGEAVACLGPNGAGKSTSIKLLTGILRPTSGEVLVRGVVPYKHRQQNAKNISVVFGQRSQLWWDIPVFESLRLLGDIYEVPAARFKNNLERFTELLYLGPLLSRPARSLSLGERMRCDLAAALLHDPALLFLDEPTIGLDVAVKIQMRSFIRQINRESGVTVILTSHDLDDIEGVCDRLVIIDHGKLLFDGSRSELYARFEIDRVVHLLLKEPVTDALERCRSAVADSSVRIEQPDPYSVLLLFDAQHTSAGVVMAAVLPLLPVEDVKVEEPSIESVIRDLYGNHEVRRVD